MPGNSFLKKLKIFTLILIFTMGAGFVFSQQRDIDSLKNELRHLPESNRRVAALTRLAILYKHNRDTTGRQYAAQALLLSRKISYQPGMADAFSQMGSFAKLSQDYPQALQLFDSAIFYYEKLKQKGHIGDVVNQKGILFMERQNFEEARKQYEDALSLYEQEKDSAQMANVLLNIGITFVRQGAYSTALDYYFRCLAIDEKLKNTAGIAPDYMSIAMIFSQQDDFASAIKYYQKSLDISEKVDDQYNVAITLTNMGIVYKDVGKLDDALRCQNRALAMFKKMNYDAGVASALHNLGVAYYTRNDLDSALHCFESSDKIATSTSDNHAHLVNEIMMARIFLKFGKLDEALSKALNAQKMAKEAGTLEEEYEATELLSEIYEKGNSATMALDMLKKGVLLKDSLFNIEKTRQIKELQTQYETTQKENQIALQESELQRKSLLQNVTWGGAALLLIVGFIGFQTYKSRQEQKRFLLDQQLQNEKKEAGRLQELDEAKSRFFANIAHEFRTPLTLILGPSGQILEESKDSKSKENAHLIHRNADRLLVLTNQLLDLSKLESGMIKLRATHSDFIAFAKGCVHSFNSLAEERDISIAFHSDETRLPMDFDAEKFSIVLNNLISNALKFTDPFGSVEVFVKSDKNARKANIEVADTGTGIAEDKLPYIFDRFYQVDDSYTRKTYGTGIGLALAKELVELHNGVISVSSEVGKGTRFMVSVPLDQSEVFEDDFAKRREKPGWADDVISHKELSKASALDEREQNKEPVILVVEDNAEVRKFIVDILANFYNTVEAENGQQGLEMAIDQVPDLIISDVMMPEMNGYQFCRILKEDGRTSHIPIIMLTAKAGMESKLEGLDTGVDDYLAKPFNARELLARIRNLILLRQKLQQKYGRTQDPSLFAQKENAFLTKLKAVVGRNIDREDFSVEELGRELAMSRTQVHRKLKALTNQSTSQFVRQFKLEKAYELLQSREFNVSEVAYKVGFNSATYFSTCFTEQFGFPPSALADNGEI